MISNYHNHDKPEAGPDNIPMKNADGTFTVTEKVFVVKLGRGEIKMKVME